LLITPQVFAMGAGGGGGGGGAGAGGAGAGAGGAGAGAGAGGAGAGGTDPSYSGAFSQSLSFYANRLGTTKTIHKGKKVHQQRAF